jgi:quercetin dioxygenase-like cupin family protein
MKNIIDSIEYPKEGILTKDVIENENLDITLFCMSKNSKISGHTSTKKATVYVIQGNGVFNLEGKDIAMIPGTIIYMKENAVHSLTAKENTSFLLTLIK